MIERQLEALSHAADLSDMGRRHHAANEDQLVLRELNPVDVVDGLDAPDDGTATFGAVREACPKCKHTHLHLVLRQHAVRVAHLLCVNCESCFDASYANGMPALTI